MTTKSALQPSQPKANPIKSLALINGANLNLLGKREPHRYGTTTLPEIERRLAQTANSHHIQLHCFQSNHEGAIVDFVAEVGLLATHAVDGVIINPAAFTHSSIAIRDALTALNQPFIEVHLSNIHAREPFRQHSYFSDQAQGVICGLGDMGYDMALQWFIKHFETTK